MGNSKIVKLESRPTMEWRIAREYKAAGTIPCYVLISTDGRFQTAVRAVDCVPA